MAEEDSVIKRLRLTFIWVLVALALGAMLPATTTAMNGFTVSVIKNKCQVLPLNGSLSYTLKLKAKITADGSTYVDTLRISSKLQRKQGISWITQSSWPDVNSYFTIDGSSHSLVLARNFSWSTNSDTNKYRLWFQLSALDSKAGGPATYTKTLTGKAGPGNSCS